MSCVSTCSLRSLSLLGRALFVDVGNCFSCSSSPIRWQMRHLLRCLDGVSVSVVAYLVFKWRLLFFSLNNPQRNGLSLVGIAGQIQVLTKYSFLAVWKTVFFPGRGLATPRLCPEPRLLHSASAPMSGISLGLPLSYRSSEPLT